MAWESGTRTAGLGMETESTPHPYKAFKSSVIFLGTWKACMGAGPCVEGGPELAQAHLCLTLKLWTGMD